MTQTVYLSQPGLQTCQTANGDEKSDLGQTGFLGSHRYNPGTPPQELREANRGATKAQEFSFTCLNSAVMLG